MKVRRSILAGVFVAGFLVVAARPAGATALAISDLTATNLKVETSGGTIVFDPLAVLMALADARNSLGEVDSPFAASAAPVPAAADAAVTWADGHAASGATQSSASSGVFLPGPGIQFGNSQGQALRFASFMVTCSSGPCGPDTPVQFSIDLDGHLALATDANGRLAFTAVAFNLNLDGDPLLFTQLQLLIGPSSADSDVLTGTFTASRNLLYDTPYTLQLRVDSESFAVNTPEPATLGLLGLGLTGLLVLRHKRSSRPPRKTHRL